MTATGPEAAVPSDGAPVPLVTRGLTRKYGALTAADSLDLEVKAGEIFGLLGPNGAGKSTTIKMLITLLPPTSGDARRRRRRRRARARLVRRRIGYVPQLVSADGALTARENLLLSARLYHLPRDGARRRDRRRARVHGPRTMSPTGWSGRISGGMIRRLELAQAMLHRPTRPVPRRADRRARPDRPGRGLGAGRAAPRSGRHDDPADHPLHGRGRRAVRPDRRDARGPTRRDRDPDRAQGRGRPGATPRRRLPALTGPAWRSEGRFRDIGRTRRTAQPPGLNRRPVVRFGHRHSTTVPARSSCKIRHDPFEIASRAVQPLLWLVVFGQVMAQTRAIPTGNALRTSTTSRRASSPRAPSSARSSSASRSSGSATSGSSTSCSRARRRGRRSSSARRSPAAVGPSSRRVIVYARVAQRSASTSGSTRSRSSRSPSWSCSARRCSRRSR